jgi:hypothetical protein
MFRKFHQPIGIKTKGCLSFVLFASRWSIRASTRAFERTRAICERMT